MTINHTKFLSTTAPIAKRRARYHIIQKSIFNHVIIHVIII